MITPQRVLTELSAKEKAASLVMTGRAIRETFIGLDIVPPEFAVIVAYDAAPLIASNILDQDQLITYIRMVTESMLKGNKVAPICVPQRMSIQDCFLINMRKCRGKVPLDPESLSGLIRTYFLGFLDGVLQFGGIKAVLGIVKQYPELSHPDWLPGPEWHYWEDRNANT